MCMDDLLNGLIYGVIPLFTVVIIFFLKRKLLRVAPLISTALAAITYMMLFSVLGMPVAELLGNSEWRAFFFLAMLIQFVIVITLTVIAYFIAYILKRKKNSLCPKSIERQSGSNMQGD